MDIITDCLCCGSGSCSIHPAIVAPFVSYYAVLAAPFPCQLLECAHCGFRFFDARLTPAEAERLYSGYRGDQYFDVRNRYEPWYSRKINDGIGSDPAEIERRKEVVLDLIKRDFDPPSFPTVLDFGGDRGQFIPAQLGREKFVFELSDAVPESGVMRLGKAEVATRRFEFLMCCGVLEHCSDPAAVVRELVALGSPDAIFYISVPYERYQVSAVPDSGSYRSYLKMLLKFPKLLMLVDFYSTVFRFRWNRVPPGGLVKCHEHLNFFDQASMRALLERAGLRVLSIEVVNVARYPAKNPSLLVLARRQ